MSTQENQNVATLSENGPQVESGPALRTLRIRPAAEVVENEQGFVLTVELPGVDRSTLEVSVEGGQLLIVGTSAPTVPAGYRPSAGPCFQRRFERAFRLSDGLDREKIEAEIKNGLLTLSIPKSAASRRAAIEVKAG